MSTALYVERLRGYVSTALYVDRMGVCGALYVDRMARVAVYSALYVERLPRGLHLINKINALRHPLALGPLSVSATDRGGTDPRSPRVFKKYL